MKHENITIFTDGASRGNPGPGGWAAIVAIPQESKVIELGGRETRTTNNRMEVTAALNALLKVKHLKDTATIHTDSSYLIQGITKWVKGWIKNGWTTQSKEQVVNRDLWELLAAVMDEREHNGAITHWKHVSGHAGIPGNERVDDIATAFADEKQIDLYNGALNEYTIDILTATPSREIKTVKDSKKSRSSKPAYSYLSQVDGKIEKHKTWAECEARVKGVKKAKFKKALSHYEEEEIIREWSK